MCPAVTTTAAGELVICVMSASQTSGNTYSGGAGFTQRSTTNISNLWEDEVQVSAGAITPGATNPGTVSVFSATMTFKHS
jgi:hypothetical protein